MLDTQNKKLLDLTKKIIAFKSITPNQNGCIDFLEKYLQNYHFQTIRIEKNSTSNLIAFYGDQNKPIIAFAGHIDVVPTGDINKWNSDPFILTEDNEKLYARGIADMKGAIAAFIHASTTLIEEMPSLNFCLAILITSDEEGMAVDGTKVIVEYLKQNNKFIKYCILGEPTSSQILGDTIKIGRRGSINCKLEIYGMQGHVAYPENCINPIHLTIPIIHELITTKLDAGNEYFPPSALQITNINAGLGVDNVIPDTVYLKFNIRYNDLHSIDSLKNILNTLMNKYNVHYKLDCNETAKPFLSKSSHLTNTATTIIYDTLGIKATLKTDGGTSDGRFLISIADEMIELGLLNNSAHQINENILKIDLFSLSNIYYLILSKICK